MIVKAVHHQGKIKIHYQNRTRAKRINTGVSISSSSDLSSDGKLKSSVEDRKSKQLKVNKLKAEAQELIDDYFFKHKKYPTGEEFNKLWAKKDSLLIHGERLLDYYDRYLVWKSKDRDITKQSSLKDYNSLKKNLQDYENFLGEEILLGDISKEWLADFEDYLTVNKGDDSYTSKCSHKPATIKKRIRTLKAFYRWLDGEEIFLMPKSLRDFKHKKSKSKTVKAVLTKEEVMKLYKYNFGDEKLDFIKDVFVLACLTGMRFSDLITVRKRHVKNLKLAGPSIVKEAVKTGYEFRVPLNSKSQEILIRYDYKLDKYSNANFNKYLHKLLEQIELFDDAIDYNGEEKHRWEAVSIHNARDTFITLLVQERVPLNEIMKYTGHQSVVNLNKYIDKDGELINYVDSLI